MCEDICVSTFTTSFTDSPGRKKSYCICKCSNSTEQPLHVQTLPPNTLNTSSFSKHIFIKMSNSIKKKIWQIKGQYALFHIYTKAFIILCQILWP